MTRKMKNDIPLKEDIKGNKSHPNALDPLVYSRIKKEYPILSTKGENGLSIKQKISILTYRKQLS